MKSMFSIEGFKKGIQDKDAATSSITGDGSNFILFSDKPDFKPKLRTVKPEAEPLAAMDSSKPEGFRGKITKKFLEAGKNGFSIKKLGRMLPKSTAGWIGLGLGGLTLLKIATDFFAEDEEATPVEKAKVKAFRAEYIDATDDRHREAEEALKNVTDGNIEEIEKQKARILRAMKEF